MDIAHAAFRIEAPRQLAADQVHLWRVDLQAIAGEEPQWAAILSPDEQARAARFHFQEHRRYFTASRAILRHVLSAYLGSDPKNVAFVYSSKNKPALGGAHAGALAFNVSHSGDIALLAIARSRPVGVDIELIRHNFDTAAIAARFFSDAEQKQLAALPPDQRHDAFFRCWTRKEAYIKALGEGLSLPLSQFDVSLTPDDGNALLATRPDALEARRWSLREVRVKPGYAAALCVQGTDWTLIDWNATPGRTP